MLSFVYPVRFHTSADGTEDYDAIFTFATRFPVLEKRMSCDSLGKFLGPVRYCSVNIELIDSDNDAQN